MAAESLEGMDPVTVEDDDEYTARRFLKRVMDSRDRVDEREDSLFNGALLEPNLDVADYQLLQAWANTVRQFIRNIEVLLHNFPDETERGGSWYLHEVDLGEVRLTPPDAPGYAFSQVSMLDEGVGEDALKQRLGLPLSTDLPRPQTRQFRGLQSIIEQEPVVGAQWSVCVDASGPPATHDYETVTRQRVVPKHIYENAVRAADRYLDGIGIGVEKDGGEYRSVEPGL